MGLYDIFDMMAPVTSRVHGVERIYVDADKCTTTAIKNIMMAAIQRHTYVRVLNRLRFFRLMYIYVLFLYKTPFHTNFSGEFSPSKVGNFY